MVEIVNSYTNIKSTCVKFRHYSDVICENKTFDFSIYLLWNLYRMAIITLKTILTKWICKLKNKHSSKDSIKY